VKDVFHVREEAEARTALVVSYQRAISQREERAQEAIRRLYKHNVFDPSLPAHSVLREDLFTERTWQVLGLNRKQVLLAAALLGAGAGVQLDLILGHVSLGLFALSGAALAVAAAWMKGENMAQAQVKNLKLGGVEISVGPNRNPQFPFVVLDRLLLYYQLTINWAHARRETAPLVDAGSDEAKLGFTARWERSRHQCCLNFINALRKGNPAKLERAERELQIMLETVLREIGDVPAP
jgi:hypothetical protein